METAAQPGHPASRPPSLSSSAADEGRFPAGTLLAERYRVAGELGQGCMGEVYKATLARFSFNLILYWR